MTAKKKSGRTLYGIPIEDVRKPWTMHPDIKKGNAEFNLTKATPESKARLEQELAARNMGEDITEEDLEEERRYNEWLSEVTDPKRHT